MEYIHLGVHSGHSAAITHQQGTIPTQTYVCTT